MAKRSSKYHECTCRTCGLAFTAPQPMDRCGECGYAEAMARLRSLWTVTPSGVAVPSAAPVLRAA